MLLKDNKYGGVDNAVYAAVEEVYISTILGWRSGVFGFPSGVRSDQHPANKHAFDISLTGVAVGVFGILGKVTTWIWRREQVLKNKKNLIKD